MNIFSQKTEAFGLDVSDFSLKLAKLEKAGDALRLASFGEAEIPPGFIENGEVKEESRLSEIIKRALSNIQGKKLRTNYAIVSLPEEKSFLDVLEIPFLKEEEIETAVRFEAENYIPLSLEEVYFDFEKIQPLSKKQKKQEVLIVAIARTIVDSYLGAFKKAGLQVKAMEIEGLAVVRALIRRSSLTKPLLLIDFGGSRTSFMIFSGRSLRFTSTIPISSQGLTKVVADTFRVSPEKAEILKREHGLEGEKKVSNAIIPPLKDLAKQIKAHLEYYHSHAEKNLALADGKTVESILLCGGGANLKGLASFLTSVLKIEVKLGNPWINILRKGALKEIPGLPFEQSLGYTTALGLALRAIYEH